MKLLVTAHGLNGKKKSLGHYEVTVQSPVVLRGGRLTNRSVKRAVKVRAGSSKSARMKAKAAGFRTVITVRRLK